MINCLFRNIRTLTWLVTLSIFLCCANKSVAKANLPATPVSFFKTHKSLFPSSVHLNTFKKKKEALIISRFKRKKAKGHRISLWTIKLSSSPSFNFYDTALQTEYDSQVIQNSVLHLPPRAPPVII